MKILLVFAEQEQAQSSLLMDNLLKTFRLESEAIKQVKNEKDAFLLLASGTLTC